MTASEPGDRLDGRWWARTYHQGLECLRLLLQRLEGGTVDLGIEPGAWETTTAALERMAGELASGRMVGQGIVTGEDVERVRRLRALGRDALAGGPRSPELLPLTRQCLVALYGPDWELNVDWDTIQAAAAQRGPAQDDGPGLDDATENKIAWLTATHLHGFDYSHRLARAIERGDADLGIDPSAWENTMAAVEWATMEHVRGRVTWTKEILTEEDVERVRHLHALGAAALSGGPRSPEIGPLAQACLVTLAGPDWRGQVEDAERRLEAVDRGLPG